MLGAGVIDADPGCRAQPGVQHVLRFAEQIGGAVVLEQASYLPAIDVDAQIAQLRGDPRDRHLPAMVQGHDQPAEIAVVVALDVPRQVRR